MIVCSDYGAIGLAWRLATMRRGRLRTMLLQITRAVTLSPPIIPMQAPMPFVKMLPLAALLATGCAVAAPGNDPWHASARQLLEQAVNIPTVAGRDRVPELAALLA